MPVIYSRLLRELLISLSDVTCVGKCWFWIARRQTASNQAVVRKLSWSVRDQDKSEPVFDHRTTVWLESKLQSDVFDDCLCLN